MTFNEDNLRAGLSKLRTPGSKPYNKALENFRRRIQSGKSENVAITETFEEAADGLAASTKESKLNAAYEAAGISRELPVQHTAKTRILAFRDRFRNRSSRTTPTQVIAVHSEDEDDEPERSTTVILLMAFLGFAVGAIVTLQWVFPLAEWFNRVVTGHYIDGWVLLVLAVLTLALFTVLGRIVGIIIFNHQENHPAKAATTTTSAETMSMEEAGITTPSKGVS